MLPNVFFLRLGQLRMRNFHRRQRCTGVIQFLPYLFMKKTICIIKPQNNTLFFILICQPSTSYLRHHLPCSPQALCYANRRIDRVCFTDYLAPTHSALRSSKQLLTLHRCAFGHVLPTKQRRLLQRSLNSVILGGMGGEQTYKSLTLLVAAFF